MEDLKVDSVIELRSPLVEAAPYLFKLINQERQFFEHWLPWATAIKSVKDEAFFLICAQKKIADNELWLWVIYYNQRPAGIIDLHQLDLTNRHGQIGYWLGRIYQKHGIMTASLNKLTDYLFATDRLHRLDLLIEASNQTSYAVAQRAGFKQQTVLRDYLLRNQVFCDAILFSKIAG